MTSFAEDGTATLVGETKYITGAAISGASAELKATGIPNREFRAQTDYTGVYRLSGLPAGEYVLKVSKPGFMSVTIKSIRILGGEQKSIPILYLHVADIADCGGHGVLDYMKIFKAQDHGGTLEGSVMLGPSSDKRFPITDADVILLCGTGRVCGATKTGLNGEFIFKALHPGIFSVRVDKIDLYPLIEPGYEIQAGFESIYLPIYIEPCPNQNCDPHLRPKRSPGACQ